MLFRPRYTLMGVLLSTLMSCASTQEQPPAPANVNPKQHISRLLSQADQTKGQEKYTLQLQAAEQAFSTHNIEQAQAILNRMPEAELEAECYVKRAWINSQIAKLHGNYFLSRDFLTSKRLLNSLPQTSPELAIRVREARAQLMLEGAEYQNALHERSLLAELLGPKATTQRDTNEAAIWQILMAMPRTELAPGMTNSRQHYTQGWYALAIASRAHQGDLTAQLADVNGWISKWPDHPAAKRLPTDLSQIKEMLATQAKQIAILLPQSGKLEPAATAIRHGIMAAWYQQAQNNPSSPKLRFYNTEGRNTNAVYDAAVADGAQLVVGPLEKERVAELAARPSLSVPTLSLNMLDTPTQNPPLLYQLGLSPEDEASQIATDAWQQGNRKALVLAPSNSVGDRNLARFSQTWRALGGKVINEYRYGANQDFGELIKRALQVDQSEERAKQIQQIVGPVQSTPQHRADVDFIFAIAQPEQARQLKPTLAFYFADDLPVLATSTIFSGDNQPALNQDMNGIRFLTLPWYFAEITAEKKSLAQTGEANANYARLYALGVDVFNLAPRLTHIQKYKDTHYYGYTGTLHLNNRGQFEREQIWATFNAAGTAQLVSVGTNSEPNSQGR